MSLVHCTFVLRPIKLQMVTLRSWQALLQVHKDWQDWQGLASIAEMAFWSAIQKFCQFEHSVLHHAGKMCHHSLREQVLVMWQAVCGLSHHRCSPDDGAGGAASIRQAGGGRHHGA